MNHLENVRKSYRPDRITTLFVGESAPHGGTFFYSQNSGLFREIRNAFHGNGHFLEDFKRNGFYLDDLVLEPVNHLAHKERRALCKQSVSSFVERLHDYKPKAVVILLHSIKPMVLEAMHEAGLPYEPFCTPYPGFGNQPRFRKAMAEIIPNLPTASRHPLLSCAIVLMFLLSSISFAQSSAQHSRRSADFVLQCRNVTYASTSLKQDGPQAKTQKSTDELRIARYGKLLKVQVNVEQYRSMAPQTRRILETPDPCKIVAETGEGFVAIFVNGSTTVHTLTIDRALTNGIWVESGFSFLEPQSKPISDTVFFTCTRDKG